MSKRVEKNKKIFVTNTTNLFHFQLMLFVNTSIYLYKRKLKHAYLKRARKVKIQNLTDTVFNTKQMKYLTIFDSNTKKKPPNLLFFFCRYNILKQKTEKCSNEFYTVFGHSL